MKSVYSSIDHSERKQEKFFCCATLMILSGVAYRFILSYFQSNWILLTLGFVVLSLYFLFLLGYQLCGEICLAYITAFYSLAMAFGVVFFTSWGDRYLLSVGFLFMQLGLFKFLASRILHQIPFHKSIVTFS